VALAVLKNVSASETGHSLQQISCTLAQTIDAGLRAGSRRAEEIQLAERDTTLPKECVHHRRMKEEIRKANAAQIGQAVECHRFVWADRQNDLTLFRSGIGILTGLFNSADK